MKYRIIHQTTYTFSESVFFEPHFFRFYPRASAHCSVDDFKIRIEPKPAGISEQLDAENNLIHFAWFNETNDSLKIEIECHVEILEFNPFNFLIQPDRFLNIPFEYGEEQKQLLHPYLIKPSLGHELIDYTRSLLDDKGHLTLEFLLGLNKNIYQEFKLETREEGAPLEAEATFHYKKGSCRDLTWMQIQICRNLGIASRFVSGYFYVENDKPSFELHAWTEVYLPGAGWVGLDPSHGILTGHLHIPIASSAISQNTMPVSGQIRGSARGKLNSYLHIDIL